MKNLHKALFLLCLAPLVVSCNSALKADNQSSKTGEPGKKVHNTPLSITPKTPIYYPVTTKEDLSGKSGRAPIDPICFKEIKEDPSQALTYDKCLFAGDAVMLGKIVAEGDNFGCTDGKIDQFGYRYEYVIKVLHVFAGEYKEQVIRVDIGPPRIQAREAELGDIIMFSAFHADDHWFLNTYLVNRPDDDTPFTYKRPMMSHAPCVVIDLPNKVGELDTLFKEMTGDAKFDKVCTKELYSLKEQRDYFSHKTDDAGRHPIGPVGQECPFELNFKELPNESK